MTSPSHFSHTFSSFAKLNLALQVFSPESNGYHPIRSIFQQISLHDNLFIDTTKSTQPQLKLSADGISMPTDESNILYSIFNHYKPRLSYDYTIHISKNIPMGSGMGGASSNAAVFLKFINSIESFNFSTADLIKEALQFGADVPFFINGGKQYISGKQDQLTPLTVDTQQTYFIIIYPQFMSSTRAIFTHFDAMFPDKPFTDSQDLTEGINDLLAVTLDYYPELKRIYTDLTTISNQTVCMTGSGSTFYIPQQLKTEANRVCEILKKSFPSFFIDVVHNIGFNSEFNLQ